MRFGSTITALMLTVAAALPALPTPAAAEDKPSAEDLAREGVERMMQALELLLSRVPQYEAPELLDNGDIIIRRKRRAPDEARPEPDKAPPDLEETRT